MPEQRTHPVDEVKSLAMEGVRRRLCIVSGDVVQCREFIAALQTAVGPNEGIEIIRDRRKGGPSPASCQSDRRRFPHVDALVKMDGYAIVPLPTNRPPRVPEPPIATRSTPRQPAEPFPAERPRLERPFVDNYDEEELERILQFKRRRAVRLGPLLILTVLVGVLAGLVLLQLPTVTTFMSRVRLASPPPVERKKEPEAPSTLQSSASVPGTRVDGGTERAAPDPARQSDSPSGDQNGLPLRAETGSVSPPEPDRPPPQRNPVLRAEPGPQPRSQTGTLASVPPTSPGRASSRLSGSVLRGEASSRFPGLPRVELVRNSVHTAEGKADSYVVRLSNPAGRPLTGADVLLRAGMSDGTVENVMLDAGPEPGTYTGTSRPSRSSPVDLRVRMTMSDKRIELPLKP